ncbi:MAG: tRNA pseudouridine(55) synthase TruB [Bacteroidota bacterium]
MKTKGNYRNKHRAALGPEDNSQRTPFVKLNIDEQTRAIFEEGKMLLIDKPLHWTSFDVVRKVGLLLKIRKVGHAGTLDPLATGLLILCTGKFTKKINEYMAQEKEYTGSFTLGAVTSTYDLESLPENPKDYAEISLEKINETVKKFRGEIDQVPPAYSALKKKGVPMYELARRGEEVNLKPRKVNILSFEIISVELPLVYFKITCSTGTYIRSIAHDFGQELGCGAYLSELRRTAIGEMNIKDAMTMDGFINMLAGMESTKP